MVEWVEEGMIARGAEPPKSEQWSEDDWVVVPPGTHLPFTKRDLVTKLHEQLPETIDRPKFDACLQLAAHVVHARAFETLEALKDDFSYFDPTATSPTDADEAELRKRERGFFSNLLTALVRGNFIPLSDELYRKAIDQRFVLDVPVKVRWERLDGTPVRSFLDWADSPEGESLRRELSIDGSLRDFIEFPEAFEERAFVFHRGLSPLQSEGTFIAAKLDIWLTRILRIVAYPIVVAVERYLEGPKRPRATNPGLNEDDPDAWRQRWVRRLGLENLPLASLFKTSRLQEPAYREMVVVFRLHPNSSKLLERLGMQKKPNEDESRRRLHIKIFRDIPLADSEIVFPENTPQMRTLDAVLLTLTALAAAPAVVKALGGGGGASLVIAIVLVTYVSKVVGQYFRARKMRMARMTQELYHKTRDNDVGVLQYLVDAGEEQDFKEIALVYGVMLHEQEPLTEKETDERVEAFVREHFSGLDVDFEIRDALRKAVDGETPLGLLEQTTGPDGQARYRARPPHEVYDALLGTWQTFAQRLHDGAASGTTASKAAAPASPSVTASAPQLAPVGSDG
ncbi:MAG: DUF3754 domain-containing protein [Myxococcota bacterium]